jgi:hypothetical protein
MSDVQAADGLDLAKYVVSTDGEGPLDSKDVFVLRSSDIFGAATLFAYAGFVLTLEEVARQRDGMFSDEELGRLTRLAEAVQDRAIEWQRQGRHLPD